MPTDEWKNEWKEIKQQGGCWKCAESKRFSAHSFCFLLLFGNNLLNANDKYADRREALHASLKYILCLVPISILWRYHSLDSQFEKLKTAAGRQRKEIQVNYNSYYNFMGLKWPCSKEEKNVLFFFFKQLVCLFRIHAIANARFFPKYFILLRIMWFLSGCVDSKIVQEKKDSKTFEIS